MSCSPSAEPESILDSFISSFQGTTRKRGETVATYSIADSKIRIHSSGVEAGVVSRALGHRKSESRISPDLTIYAWSSKGSDSTIPPMPWAPEDIREQGQVRGYNTIRLATNFNIDSLTLTMVDLERGIGIWWRPVEDPMPLYERAAPLRHIFNAWFEKRGLHFVHGAAVGNENGCLVLAGGGGSGKSTTALACMLNGLDYIADDYLLLQSVDSQLMAHSVYCSAKTAETSIALMPHLFEHITNPDQWLQEKALLYLSEIPDTRLTGSMTVRAIAIPTVSGNVESSFSPLSKSKALLALAPSTIFQQPGTGANRFDFLSRIVRDIPCFSLSVGSDLRALTDMIISILEIPE